jgi:hypothetical protein
LPAERRLSNAIGGEGVAARRIGAGKTRRAWLVRHWVRVGAGGSVR